MTKSFEFYFDFGSPYSFLAHEQIKKIEKEKEMKVKYMPILLGALLKLAGLKPLVNIPIKGKYISGKVINDSKDGNLSKLYIASLKPLPKLTIINIAGMIPTKVPIK